MCPLGVEGTSGALDPCTVKVEGAFGALDLDTFQGQGTFGALVNWGPTSGPVSGAELIRAPYKEGLGRVFYVLVKSVWSNLGNSCTF